MKGTLIKTGDDYYYLSIPDDSTNNFIASIDGMYVEHKLSLKNCEAIENGYDLDELVEEYLSSRNITSTGSIAKVGRIIFEDSFQKAMELMEGKNKELKHFVNDCATNWDCDKDAHRYDTPCRVCDAEKLIQPKEWEVEIVTKPFIEVNPGFELVPKREPKLDREGCLILRKYDK